MQLLQDTAASRGIKLDIVVDIIHVVEYLWRAAYCFHEEGTPDAQAWVSERRLHPPPSSRQGHLATRATTYVSFREPTPVVPKELHPCNFPSLAI